MAYGVHTFVLMKHVRRVKWALLSLFFYFIALELKFQRGSK